ncbi:MAG: beta-ketoacyl-ACP synthase [Candidatus Gastranaerophilales bacterium]|nr:beta-ketoacyl-ACP synthase [Candidatus Gastranaerophilales bacterium]
MDKRVVVTGMAIASPLGSTVSSAFERLHVLKNCIVKDDDLAKYNGLHTRLASKIDGLVIPQEFNRKVTRTMGRVALISVITAKQALEDAELIGNPVITSGQTGVSYGSCSGAIDSLMDFYSMIVEHDVKNLNSGSYVRMMSHTAAVNISLYFKTHGRVIPTSSACTSGSMGIGYAYEAIKLGLQKVMIAGGSDEFTPSNIGIFDTLFATSVKNDNPELTPSPFDKDRDGLVIGEGAATLILEEYEHAKNRGAKIYAEIVGFATNADGTHITNPNSEMMAEVMKQSLDSANLSAADIGYINAHGTGTVNGDIAESQATSSVFGKNVPVSTIKCYTGHTLGACGAIEALLSIEMMNHNWFCPNLNLKNVDERCGELEYIMGQPRTLDAEFVMSNNFAFGGINTSLIFKKV